MKRPSLARVLVSLYLATCAWLALTGNLQFYGKAGESTNGGVVVTLPGGHDAGVEVWGHPGPFFDTF